nr:MAG: hypothetical protein [Microvirus sp.]
MTNKYYPVQYIDVDTGLILRATEMKNKVFKVIECNVTEKKDCGICHIYTEKLIKTITEQLTINF